MKIGVPVQFTGEVRVVVPDHLSAQSTAGQDWDACEITGVSGAWLTTGG